MVCPFFNINGITNSPINTASNTPIRVQLRLREAMHEIAYSYCHAKWRNATHNATADPADKIISIPPKEPYLWWKPAVISLDALVYSGLGVGMLASLFNGILFRRKEIL